MLSTAALAVALALSLAACDTQAPEVAATEAVWTLEAEVILPNGVRLPEGTRIGEEVSGDGRKRVTFALPPAHRLIGYSAFSHDVDGEPVSVTSESGDVTCGCTDGGENCNPFRARAGDRVRLGCASSGCRTCRMEISAAAGERLEQADVFDVSRPVDLSRPVDIVFTRTQADFLGCATAPRIGSALAQEALAAFVDWQQITNVEAVRRARSEAELPEGYEMVLVDLFGRIARVPIEASRSMAMSIREVTLAAEAVELEKAGLPIALGEAGFRRCGSG